MIAMLSSFAPSASFDRLRFGQPDHDREGAPFLELTDLGGAVLIGELFGLPEFDDLVVHQLADQDSGEFHPDGHAGRSDLVNRAVRKGPCQHPSFG